MAVLIRTYSNNNDDNDDNYDNNEYNTKAFFLK